MGKKDKRRREGIDRILLGAHASAPVDAARRKGGAGKKGKGMEGPGVPRKPKKAKARRQGQPEPAPAIRTVLIPLDGSRVLWDVSLSGRPAPGSPGLERNVPMGTEPPSHPVAKAIPAIPPTGSRNLAPAVATGAMSPLRDHSDRVQAFLRKFPGLLDGPLKGAS
jgi:hypothetical protein